MEGAPKSREQIVGELKELKSKFYRDPDLYEKLIIFGQSLREKYSDCEEYELFHLLIGSGLREGHIPKNFDFPEEDSVEVFLRSIE